MIETYSFGAWIKQRRKEMRLTQHELAMQAACAVATIKKIESDERRPSVEIAELIADGLSVPANWRERFVACARGKRAIDTLAGMSIGEQTESTTLLPTPPTPFIGRQDELAEIERTLVQADCHLLTLVGPGGIGKTRLAIESAYKLNETFEDGSVFVPLAAANDSLAITTSIIRSLNLSLTNEEQLFNVLRQQKILIILDNCEQLGDEVAWFTRLLDQAPNIKLLVTSRERLNLHGEWVFNVPQMAQEHAIELLHKSGQRAVSNLTVSEDEAASVCKVVENLPLAVELAAGWLHFMSCEQIVQSIQRDVDFLATNMRDIPERHRSIRAVFDYSWKLLSEQEQETLMCLSAFRGGWTVNESQAVAGANLPRLRVLIDKSLVRPAGNGRYDLHELIRQYAAEKLRESGLETATYERHAETYVQFCENVLILASENGDGPVFERAERELGNCQIALRWSIDNGKPETALRMLWSTFLPWLRRGLWQEAEYWYREALTAAGDQKTIWVCRGLLQLGTFLAVQGRYKEAFPFSSRAWSLSEELDDPVTKMAVAEQRMQAESNIDDARKWFETFVPLVKAWHHPMSDGRLSGAYCLFGDRLRDSGHYAEAKDFYHKALEIDKSRHGIMSIYTIGNLGRIALQEGHFHQAYNQIRQCVHLMRENGSRVGMADWIIRLGEVSLYIGDLAQAEINFEEAMALYEEIRNIRAATDSMSYLAHTAILQKNLNIATERLRSSLPSHRHILREFLSLAENHSWKYSTALVNALFCTAFLCSHREQNEVATTIIGCATLLREKDPMQPEPQLQALVEKVMANLRKSLGDKRYTALLENGKSLTVGDALDFAIECLSISH